MVMTTGWRPSGGRIVLLTHPDTQISNGNNAPASTAGMCLKYVEDVCILVASWFFSPYQSSDGFQPLYKKIQRLEAVATFEVALATPAPLRLCERKIP